MVGAADESAHPHCHPHGGRSQTEPEALSMLGRGRFHGVTRTLVSCSTRRRLDYIGGCIYSIDWTCEKGGIMCTQLSLCIGSGLNRGVAATYLFVRISPDLASKLGCSPIRSTNGLDSIECWPALASVADTFGMKTSRSQGKKPSKNAGSHQ